MTASRRGTLQDARRDRIDGGMRRIITRLRQALLCGCALAVASCNTVNSVTDTLLGKGDRPEEGTPGYVSGFLGAVVADEPRAVLTARDVLSAGGSAADAAVALAFALSVTLPSRAGIGAGGACLAYAPDRKSVNGGVPEAILFMPVAASGGSARTDRPAAVPMLPRGMFALHARYGKRPLETLISPAEQLARFGIPVSRAFIRDFSLVSAPLLADPNARAVFAPGGQPVREGSQMIQMELGATLGNLRAAGVGDLYQGSLARRLEQGTPAAGVAISIADLRGALPGTAVPITLRQGNDEVAFLPPPADGGLAAAAAFQALAANPNDVAGAEARASGMAMAWRSRGGDPTALLAESVSGANLPPMPASTSFTTLDKDGNAVACVLTMGNLFGTGRMAPGMGFLVAASPHAVTPPLLAAAIAYNARLRAFRAAVGGSGQGGAPTAVAVGMMNTLRSQQPMAAEVPDPGRANVIACGRYLPDAERTCAWATDPRGSGLAQGSN